MKVLFKEFIAVWTRELVQWLSRKFDSISIDLTPVEGKQDEQFIHFLMQTRNGYNGVDTTGKTAQINRIVVRYGANNFRNYDLVGSEVVDGVTYYKWATANTLPIGYVYTDKWTTLRNGGNDIVYTKDGDAMVRLTDQYGNYINTWQAQFFKTATSRDIDEAEAAIMAALGNIDFSPVEEKLDDVEEKIDNINVESADQVAQFFGLPQALPGSYVPASTQKILMELEDIWHDVTGDYAPISSFTYDGLRRDIRNGVVWYIDIDENTLG